MTIVVKVLRGSKHTFWNVERVTLTATGVIITDDRGDTPVQGFIESIVRTGWRD